jgi:hypothetical protein
VNDNPSEYPVQHSETPAGAKGRWARARRAAGKKTTVAIVTATLVAAALGLTIGLATSSPTPANQSASGNLAAFGAKGSNARSAPSPGGAAGKVGKVSASTFTMTTSAGQGVTVDETASTKYENGTKSVKANAITKGSSVLVLGITNSTTITADEIIVEPSSSPFFATSSTVIPFTRGSATNLKQSGQIPANWSQGSGTIVSGTAADKATEAALAAYPGAIVDRVVKLSNGEYNVHYIGVNWPHHVFLSHDFKVVGAE